MRSFFALALIASLATAAHGANPAKQRFAGTVTLGMLGQRIKVPTRLEMQIHGDRIYSRAALPMQAGGWQWGAVTRGRITRASTRNGMTILQVTHEGRRNLAALQADVNSKLDEVQFEFDDARGESTYLFRPDGSVATTSNASLTIGSLSGPAAQKMLPVFQQLMPDGQFRLSVSGVLKPVGAR